MNNKEQQKRAIRLQHSNKAQKDAPGRRWADRQVADVRGGNHKVTSDTEIEASRIGGFELAASSVSTSELANISVTSAKLATGAVTAGKMGSGVVGSGELADGGVIPQKLDRSYVQPGNTGSATVNSLGSSHSHSMSSTTFIKQSRETRYKMLDDRSDLETLLESESLSAADQVIAQNVHNLLVLLMDYREMNAYEREEALVDPALAAWADTYKRVYGVDEYAEGDRENFLHYRYCEGEAEEHVHVRMDPYEGIAPSA